MDQSRAIKRVMSYLQRMKDFMLIYGNCDDLKIAECVDSDFVGSTNDMKSTSSYVFKLVGEAIS